MVKRAVYQGLMGTIRAYQRVFLDLRVRGRENIPRGAKIFVTNHITTTDPYWVLPFFGEPVHVIIGPGYQSKVAAWVFDHFEQINAMPAQRKTVADKAVAYLRRGESVYTAPEGDLQDIERLGRFFPGVGRIYRRCPAPIIPIGLFAPREAMKAYPRLSMDVEGRVYRTVVVLRGPYFINIGAPFCPTICPELDEDADAGRISDELCERVQGLVDEVRC